MSMPIATLSSPAFKIPSLHRLNYRFRNQTVSFRSSSIKTLPFNPQSTRKRFGLFYSRNLGFCLNASENGQGERKTSVDDDAERLARGESTMPDRFRHLTKEAPDRPVRWPWFVGMF